MLAPVDHWQCPTRGVKQNKALSMSISDSISRFTSYYSRHGFSGTLRRATLTCKRTLFANRMVVFYCDLSSYTADSTTIPSSLAVHRLTKATELDPQVLQEMTSFWNPGLARRNIKERFSTGASLWLIRSEGQLAGYGWSLQSSSMEPYYFPLAHDDVHLFDFHVFPQFRGRGINPYLVTHILGSLANTTRGRAFIEAAEWNHAQLSSLQKTPFCQLGKVRSFEVFGHRLTVWKKIATSRRLEIEGRRT